MTVEDEAAEMSVGISEWDEDMMGNNEEIPRPHRHRPGLRGFHLVAMNVEPVASYPKNRECKTCGHSMSRYNSHESCWACVGHGAELNERHPSARRRINEEKAGTKAVSATVSEGTADLLLTTE